MKSKITIINLFTSDNLNILPVTIRDFYSCNVAKREFNTVPQSFVPCGTSLKDLMYYGNELHNTGHENLYIEIQGNFIDANSCQQLDGFKYTITTNERVTFNIKNTLVIHHQNPKNALVYFSLKDNCKTIYYDPKINMVTNGISHFGNVQCSLVKYNTFFIHNMERNQQVVWIRNDHFLDQPNSEIKLDTGQACLVKINDICYRDSKDDTKIDTDKLPMYNGEYMRLLVTRNEEFCKIKKTDLNCTQMIVTSLKSNGKGYSYTLNTGGVYPREHDGYPSFTYRNESKDYMTLDLKNKYPSWCSFEYVVEILHKDKKRNDNYLYLGEKNGKQELKENEYPRFFILELECMNVTSTHFGTIVEFTLDDSFFFNSETGQGAELLFKVGDHEFCLVGERRLNESTCQLATSMRLVREDPNGPKWLFKYNIKSIFMGVYFSRYNDVRLGPIYKLNQLDETKNQIDEQPKDQKDKNEDEYQLISYDASRLPTFTGEYMKLLVTRHEPFCFIGDISGQDVHMNIDTLDGKNHFKYWVDKKRIAERYIGYKCPEAKYVFDDNIVQVPNLSNFVVEIYNDKRNDQRNNEYILFNNNGDNREIIDSRLSSKYLRFVFECMNVTSEYFGEKEIVYIDNSRQGMDTFNFGDHEFSISESNSKGRGASKLVTFHGTGSVLLKWSVVQLSHDEYNSLTKV